MSEVSFTRDIACSRDHIRGLLLNEDFLTQFVQRRHTVEYDISVDADEAISTIRWLVATDAMPGIARRLVGETIPLRLVITSPGVAPDQDGSVSLDLEGKVKGHLQASLSVQTIEQPLPSSALLIRGAFTINAGLLSGMASDMARDHLIVPLFGELADLLQEW